MWQSEKATETNSYFILSIALSISAYRLFPITYAQSKIMTRCPNSWETLIYSSF